MVENFWPTDTDISGPGIPGIGGGRSFYPHNPDSYEYSEDKEDTQEEIPVTSERNHDKVWEEEIELPERKESKQIPNPWE